MRIHHSILISTIIYLSASTLAMSKQFYIRLQHGELNLLSISPSSIINSYFYFYFPGISGGFAPPNPTSVQQITSSLSGGAPSVLLQTTTRGPGQRRLPDEPTAESTLPSSTITKVDKLVAELESILKKLPTELPPGSKDIYGMDIGLTFGNENVEWMNGGPQGCGGGFSEVEVTEAEREEFKRAVAIVEELVKLGQVDTAAA